MLYYAVVYCELSCFIQWGVTIFKIINRKPGPRSMLLYKSFPFWKELHVCAYSGPRLKADLFCVKLQLQGILQACAMKNKVGFVKFPRFYGDAVNSDL